MRRWMLPVGGAAALLLTACPYHGTVPLGPPEPGGFDGRLLGEWVTDTTYGAITTEKLWITRFDDGGYVVAGLGDCPAGGGRAHLTTLRDRVFLNLREESEDGLYRIGRVELDGSVLRLTLLSDSIGTVSTSDSLRARLLARLDDPVLYESTVSYQRTPTPLALQGSAALAMLPQACPYQGGVLLEAAADASALDALVGSWRGHGGSEAVDVEVTRDPGGHARIAIAGSLGEGLGGGGPESVYASRVGDAVFLNGAGDDTWLARLDVAGDTIEIRLINSSVRAATPADLHRLLADRLDDASIYYWQTFRLVRR